MPGREKPRRDTSLFTLTIGKKCFSYEEIGAFLNRPGISSRQPPHRANTPADARVPSAPVYVHAKYEESLLDNLYLLQHRVPTAHVLVLFSSRDLDPLLRHINIFPRLTFTLVPKRASMKTFSKVYDFFFFSRMSESFITWAGSLILRYQRKNPTILADEKLLSYAPCDGSCFLPRKNCSKNYLATFLLHPSRRPPSEKEISLMCDIQREFSLKALTDMKEGADDLHLFDKARKSIGIRTQYWLDPLSLYS